MILIKTPTAWLTGFLLLLQAAYSTSDAVINAVLKFMKTFFRVVGQFSEFVAQLSQAIPSSLYALRKNTLDENTEFMKFVVCPKCHKLYRFADCVEKNQGLESSKKCAFIRYPLHPHSMRRKPCDSLLLKTVTLSSGVKLLYPLKAYPYKPLFSSIRHLVLQPDFVSLCQHWKTRSAELTYMSDVYDGQIWKDFQVVEGQPFLSCETSLGLGLILNVDWFQPFKHSTYSVGAIYLTIMNLPRSVRFKRQNVILVGILPGPSEPKHDINSYIEPLVEELQDFWVGVKLAVNSSIYSDIVVRCALLCIACDLPAGQKLCGF